MSQGTGLQRSVQEAFVQAAHEGARVVGARLSCMPLELGASECRWRERETETERERESENERMGAKERDRDRERDRERGYKWKEGEGEREEKNVETDRKTPKSR